MIRFQIFSSITQVLLRCRNHFVVVKIFLQCSVESLLPRHTCLIRLYHWLISRLLGLILLDLWLRGLRLDVWIVSCMIWLIVVAMLLVLVRCVAIVSIIVLVIVLLYWLNIRLVLIVIVCILLLVIMLLFWLVLVLIVSIGFVVSLSGLLMGGLRHSWILLLLFWLKRVASYWDFACFQRFHYGACFVNAVLLSFLPLFRKHLVGLKQCQHHDEVAGTFECDRLIFGDFGARSLVFVGSCENRHNEIFDCNLHIIFGYLAHQLLHFFKVWDLTNQIIFSGYSLLSLHSTNHFQASLDCVELAMVGHNRNTGSHLRCISEVWFYWAN